MRTIEKAISEYTKYLKTGGVDGAISATVDSTAFDETKFNRLNCSFDEKYDDAYFVDIRQGSGKIVGTNERSVLLGVYDLLRKMGVMFLRPGKDGEY